MLDILSSTLFGPIIGAIGGLGSQWIAYKNKALDLEDRAKARTHERDMMVWRHRNAVEIAKIEQAGAERQAVIEGESQAAALDLQNLGATIASLPRWSGVQPEDSPGLRWFKSLIEAAQALVRVFLTLFLGVALGVLTWHVWGLVVAIQPDALPADAVQGLALLVVRGFLEAATTAIMFWFGARSAVLKPQRLGLEA